MTFKRRSVSQVYIDMKHRFYDTQTDNIIYSDLVIGNLLLFLYRDMIPFVAQGPSIFEGAICSNILMGVDRITIAEKPLYRDCQEVGTLDFILFLPER